MCEEIHKNRIDGGTFGMQMSMSRKMKRILALLFAVTTMFAFATCAAADNSTQNAGDNANSDEQSIAVPSDPSGDNGNEAEGPSQGKDAIAIYFLYSENTEDKDHPDAVSSATPYTNLEISDLEVMTDILKEELETAGRTLDTYPIIVNEKYDADFDVMVDPARTDITEDREFTFESELPDLEGYKDIYFGVPVWWGTYPQPVKSFLKQNGVNFSGKTVHFYNTHLGSRLGDMVKQMESLAPEAVIAADPFVLSADQDIREDDSAFREWIQNQ